MKTFREFLKEASALGRDLFKDPKVKDMMYKQYHQSYQDQGYKPWSPEDYFIDQPGFTRAPGWLFFGNLPNEVPENEVGVVSARVAGPILKLTGTQGPSLSGKSKGFKEALDYANTHNLGVFSALDKKMAGILVKKFGLIAPPPKVAAALFPYMQNSSEFQAGGTWDSVNPQTGAISFKMHGLPPGEDVVEKHLVGNEKFFEWMVNTKIMPKLASKLNLPANMLKMAKMNPSMLQMAAPQIQKAGLDLEVVEFLLKFVK